MSTCFRTELPDGVTPDEIMRDLQDLADGIASIDIRPAARSGARGKLGQIDPALWEIVVHFLDTKAAAAAVQSLIGGVTGYLLAKTGKKPVPENRSESKKAD